MKLYLYTWSTAASGLVQQLGSKIKRARGAPADFSEVLH